ncbi:hypothetical protein B1B_12459 [mine drainage metagenome]|uniref:Uncharacterized protein n=1 Tax=mine drainage metagenome TaxID=410659 RepID=T0ZG31_9ZZZZ
MSSKLRTGISGGQRVSLKGPVPLDQTGWEGSVGRPAVRLEGSSATINLNALSMAVRRSVGHDGMRKEDAEAIASNILNFFGFNERIIDNVLEPDDRDTFYMLEDCGILETERDETTLYDGREWRIHYWMFRKDRILELAREEAEATGETLESPTLVRLPTPPSLGGVSFPPADHDIYHHLGDHVWQKDEEEDGFSSPDELPPRIPRDRDRED